MSGLLGTNNHHSLLPPSGRTSSSGFRNDFIHKSSIHCSSSQLSVLMLDCFHIRLGNLVIIDVMIGCFGFSSFLEFSCSSLVFGSMEFLIDSMP